MARPHKIPRHLHGVIRELDIEGLSSVQIQSWLAENHKLVVGDDAILRLLKRVRIVPPVDGEGLSDLIAVRSSLRADLRSGDWKQKHSAARLLVEIHTIIAAERREAEAKLDALDGARIPAKAYSVAASPDDFPDPQETQPNAPGSAEGAE